MEDQLWNDIQAVADAFYQNHPETGMQYLPELSRLIAARITTLDTAMQQQCIERFQMLTEAMEQNAYIMIADILIFELRDRLYY